MAGVRPSCGPDVPTIASRRDRRVIAMTTDPDLLGAIRTALPEAWQVRQAASFDAIGDFDEVLQHRYLVLDLDATAFDPLEIIREARVELMLNIPIFGFGGDAGMRAAALQGRADRCFDRSAIADRVAAYCIEFGW